MMFFPALTANLGVMERSGRAGRLALGITAASLSRFLRPSPLNRLSVDLGVYEIGWLLARREAERQRVRRRRMRRSLAVGAVLGAAAVGAMRAHGAPTA